MIDEMSHTRSMVFRIIVINLGDILYKYFIYNTSQYNLYISLDHIDFSFGQVRTRTTARVRAARITRFNASANVKDWRSHRMNALIIYRQTNYYMYFNHVGYLSALAWGNVCKNHDLMMHVRRSSDESYSSARFRSHPVNIE